MDALRLTRLANFVARELTADDEPDVQSLFGESESYFRAATGDTAGPGDVQSLFYAVPDGTELDAKRLLVLVYDGVVIGLVDAVLGHPEQDAVTVGLFLLRPAYRRKGLGNTAAAALIQHARELGIRRVIATTPPGWEAGRAFLEHLGFTVEDPEEARHQTGNRNAGPREPAVLRGTLELRAS